MMEEHMQTQPNDPCPCGSGQKYKRCCGTPEAVAAQARRRRTRSVAASVGLVGLAGGLIALASAIPLATGRTTSPPPPTVSTTQEGSGTQPQTKRVWSPEHGHWHNVPVSSVAQPPGPAPAGKVWSPEHGHWHDVAPATSGALQPQPPGPAPAGKVWSPEHGHWHDAPASAGSDQK